MASFAILSATTMTIPEDSDVGEAVRIQSFTNGSHSTIHHIRGRHDMRSYTQTCQTERERENALVH